MQNSDAAAAPSISFDLEKNTFSFSFDLLSSYYSVGSIKINEDTVTCTTDDNKYTFKFNIQNSDSISFIAEASSSTETIDGKLAVPDGAIFKFQSKCCNNN